MGADTDRETSATGTKLPKLLEIIPTLAAATSFIVLSLAFVHEWAFYNVIGGQFQQLMGITDYFNSAIVWLPWFVLGICSSMILGFTDNTRSFTSEAKATFYAKHRVRWVTDNIPLWSIFSFGVVGGGFQFLFGDWYARPGLELLFMVFWAVVVKYLVTNNMRTASALPKETIYILMMVPTLLFFTFTAGASEAAYAPTKTETSFVGRLKKPISRAGLGCSTLAFQWAHSSRFGRESPSIS